jgi:hypothetical protein
MLRRLFGTALLATAFLGSLAAFVPSPATARECIVCPQIAIECGTCYKLVPQSCDRCAYCKRIPGCKP